MTPPNESAGVPSVEQAFLGLEDAPPLLQGLLRPVLVRALGDADLMRQLGSGALSQHLAVLGEILTTAGSAAHPPAYLHLAVGEHVEDIEEAYRFAQSLDAPLRARVESGLSRGFQIASSNSDCTLNHPSALSLLALARLLVHAFANLRYVEHIVGGGAIESFLPLEAEQALPKGGAKRADPALSPELANFVGEIVEVVAVAEGESDETGHVFVSIGRVLEMSPGHVVLETLRSADDERPGSRLLLGMAHIVSMRTLPSGSSARASQVG